MKADHIRTDDIEASIENAGAGQLVTAGELIEHLDTIQEGFERLWGEYCDLIEEGQMTVAHEADEVLVLASHTGHEWNETINALDIDDEYGEVGSALIQVHHRAAKRLCDYSWATAEPFVIAKHSGINDGEHLTEGLLAWLMNERGLSGGVALDYLMVEYRGMSQRAWANRAGKDQGTVSQNISKAKDRVPR
jgi:hypothetical protein